MPIYPREFIQSFELEAARNSCFVLMPFARSFDDTYGIIRDACESPAVLLECNRADDFFGAGHIMEDVLRGIMTSEYVVADVTGKNPNVFYELGIAHSCKSVERVLIIAQSLEDVPFDLRHLRCITYRNDPAGLRCLRSELERAFVAQSADVFRFVANESSAHEFRDRLCGKNDNFYTFTLDQLHVARGATKFAIAVHRESLDEGNATLKADYHYVEAGHSAPIRPTDWEIRLDRTSGTQAFFTVQRSRNHSEPSPKRRARR